MNQNIVGKAKNFEKSYLEMANLNDLVDGAETAPAGREFQIGTILQEKKNFLLLHLNLTPVI